MKLIVLIFIVTVEQFISKMWHRTSVFEIFSNNFQITFTKYLLLLHQYFYIIGTQIPQKRKLFFESIFHNENQDTYIIKESQ